MRIRGAVGREAMAAIGMLQAGETLDRALLAYRDEVLDEAVGIALEVRTACGQPSPGADAAQDILMRIKRKRTAS